MQFPVIQCTHKRGPLNWPLLKKVIIHIKTNEFFIFISKKAIFENIFLDGHDLEILNENQTSSCYNNPNLNCCSENDYLQNYEDNDSSCSMFNRKIKPYESIKFYGLFNLEAIFDDLLNNDNPILLINNCTFDSFLPIIVNKGWSSLFALSPYSGSFILNNTYFSNCYFPKSFVYYSISSYDILFTLINNDDFNLKNLQQSIVINNTVFEKINNYFIDNMNIGNFSFINLIGYNGNLTISDCKFYDVFLYKNLILFQNLNPLGVLKFNNIVLNNIWEMSVFLIASANSLSILSFNIQNLSFTEDSHIFRIENVFSIDISEITLNLINLESNFNVFNIINSNVYFSDSFFQNSILNSLFYLQSSFCTILNCTFENINCSSNFLSFIDSNMTNISSSYFDKISGDDSLFFVSSINYFILEKSIIRATIFSTIFFY